MSQSIALSRHRAAALLACGMAAALVLGGGAPASAAIVATVPLATAARYAVLGASTVTNTGNSVLNGSLGLAPGTSITGFPPGQVVAPGTTDVNNAAAQQAQSDLTLAYVDAAGRPLDGTTTADLGNLILQGGVYAGPSKGALSLTGPLVLDGAGNSSSVFIFQTNSTLITASSSTVMLINGAQECNVFWQVGSSATLGSNSVFVGNILALTSVTVNNGVTVRGRALARNAAVTLDNDTFTTPSCAQAAPGTTTTTAAATTTTAAATTTTGVGTTTTTGAAATTTTRASTTTGAAATTTTVRGITATTVRGITATTTRVATATTSRRATPTTTRRGTATTQPANPSGAVRVTTPTGSGPEVRSELPRTGAPIGTMLLSAALAIILGAAAMRVGQTGARPTR